MSFVRSYSKHEASYIFDLHQLNLVAVARSYALLRLPKMPELKNVPRDGWGDTEVEVRIAAARLFWERAKFSSSWASSLPPQWSEYAFVDPQREEARKKDLRATQTSGKETTVGKKRKVNQATRRSKQTGAWSNKLDRKEAKAARKEKKERKMAFLANVKKKARQEEPRAEEKEEGNDWLEEEEREWKRLKKEKKRRATREESKEQDPRRARIEPFKAEDLL